MTPGSDRGSRGRHPHSLGRSNLQVGSELGTLAMEHGREQAAVLRSLRLQALQVPQSSP